MQCQPLPHHVPGLENVWSLKPPLGCQPFMTGSNLRRLQCLRRAKSLTLTAYVSKEGRSWLPKGGPGSWVALRGDFTAPHPEQDFRTAPNQQLLYVSHSYWEGTLLVVILSSIPLWYLECMMCMLWGRSGWQRGIHTLSC